MILLSPAKIQQQTRKPDISEYTEAFFMKEAGHLVKLIRKLSVSEISSLLAINQKITFQTIDRYRQWQAPFTVENAMQAMYTFDGEVFRGLGAFTMNSEDVAYAQNNLRIFSGLYGLLRPLDLIQPYRLEVSSKLKNRSGDDLYPFWKDLVTKKIIAELKQVDSGDIIYNLASSEYFKTLDLNRLKYRIIDFEFYEFSEDNLKQAIIYTKKARGLLAAYIIKNKIEDPEMLKGFSDGGYWYYPALSTENKFVFVR
jgi:hypothetical protein